MPQRPVVEDPRCARQICLACILAVSCELIAMRCFVGEKTFTHENMHAMTTFPLRALVAHGNGAHYRKNIKLLSDLGADRSGGQASGLVYGSVADALHGTLAQSGRRLRGFLSRVRRGDHGAGRRNYD